MPSPIHKDGPTRVLLRKFAEQTLAPGQEFSRKDAVRWFAEHYPMTSPTTVAMHVRMMAVNDPRFRKYHPQVKPGKGWDLFFRLGSGRFRLWDEATDGLAQYPDLARAVSGEDASEEDGEEEAATSGETAELAMGGSDFEASIRTIEPIFSAAGKGAEVDALWEVYRTAVLDLNDIGPSYRAGVAYEFLSHFLPPYDPPSDRSRRIFTLNYDTLLHRFAASVSGHAVRGRERSVSDQFGGWRPYNANMGQHLVTWREDEGRDAAILYLHGSILFFNALQSEDTGRGHRDASPEVIKVISGSGAGTLSDRIEAQMRARRYPLLVPEGESGAKLRKIESSPYLRDCFRELRYSADEQDNCFFTYGCSFRHEDDHIYRTLAEGRFPRLYVGTMHDPSSDEGKIMGLRLQRLVETRKRARGGRHPLEVRLFDSDSAKAWWGDDGVTG